jgi:hypothetical protein
LHALRAPPLGWTRGGRRKSAAKHRFYDGERGVHNPREGGILRRVAQIAGSIAIAALDAAFVATANAQTNDAFANYGPAGDGIAAEEWGDAIVQVETGDAIAGFMLEGFVERRLVVFVERFDR